MISSLGRDRVVDLRLPVTGQTANAGKLDLSGAALTTDSFVAKEVSTNGLFGWIAAGLSKIVAFVRALSSGAPPAITSVILRGELVHLACEEFESKHLKYLENLEERKMLIVEEKKCKESFDAANKKVDEGVLGWKKRKNDLVEKLCSGKFKSDAFKDLAKAQKENNEKLVNEIVYGNPLLGGSAGRGLIGAMVLDDDKLKATKEFKEWLAMTTLEERNEYNVAPVSVIKADCKLAAAEAALADVVEKLCSVEAALTGFEEFAKNSVGGVYGEARQISYVMYGKMFNLLKDGVLSYISDYAGDRGASGWLRGKLKNLERAFSARLRDGMPDGKAMGKAFAELLQPGGDISADDEAAIGKIRSEMRDRFGDNLFAFGLCDPGIIQSAPTT
ncbi:MAG: hypothetical protein LBI39_03910 [Puniceicoccales bacterium]|nr:hypothetical protein [Puniceicoccales bacterium]